MTSETPHFLESYFLNFLNFDLSYGFGIIDGKIATFFGKMQNQPLKYTKLKMLQWIFKKNDIPKSGVSSVLGSQKSVLKTKNTKKEFHLFLYVNLSHQKWFLEPFSTKCPCNSPIQILEPVQGRVTQGQAIYFLEVNQALIAWSFSVQFK